MRNLLLGVSLLALSATVAPAVYAQQTNAAATSLDEGAGKFVVYFQFDRSTLTASARKVIADAAEAYTRTGNVRVQLSGHADKTGSAGYNQALSERRAEAVTAELVRLGVPQAQVSVMAEGDTMPAVPTAEGVKEARNRRVEIQLPPAEPAPMPMAEAPPPEPAPPPAPMAEKPDRFTFSLGPVYGHNFGESDRNGGNKTDDDLVGGELVFNALPGFLGGVSIKQDVLWAFNAVDEGIAGRTVASLDFAPDLKFFRPRLSLNAGGVYGNGLQDGFVIGPEIGFDLNLPGGFTLRPKVAYDYQFRNADWDQGIIWGGLDLGLRF